MADIAAVLVAPPVVLAAGVVPVPAALLGFGGAAVVTTYYMMWPDPDCGSPTIRRWTAPIDDVNGTYYTGPKCGATPVTNAAVLFQKET
jgi:predicted RNA-binding Zn-ribbon protein involved in translation (DUF1610 family)